MALEMNYLDDILDASVNARRKYNLIQNDDGTVSFEDVTKYTQSGSVFGAKDVNEIIREIISLKAKDLGFENLSNPNLLINGDFRVNQRGQTLYENLSGSFNYGVDRWTNTWSNMSVLEKGIKMYGSTDMSLRQFIEQDLTDKEVTMQIGLIDGRKFSHTLKSNKTVSDYANFDNVNGGNMSIGVEYDSSRQLYVLRCIFRNMEEIDIEWIKLEQGSIATPFVPRHFAEELLSCWRYHYTSNNGYGDVLSQTYRRADCTNGRMYFPTVMRVSPTVDVAMAQVRSSTSGDATITSKSIEFVIPEMVSIALTHSDISLEDRYAYVWITADAEIR